MRQFLIFSVCIGLQLVGCTSQSNKGLEPSDAKALGKQLMNNLPGIFSLDQDNKERLGGYSVPPILNGNWILASHPISLVESFTKETQAIATIFVKVDDEFVRLMTTEPNEKTGTALPHSHPAYQRLIGELRYTNKVTLSGNDYMADYDVFRDRQGRIIGAYLVGIPMAQPISCNSCTSKSAQSPK
jgi:methyl-accepting chemotaxis protein